MVGSKKDDLGRAVELFNSGHYYEAHEVLERLWTDAEGDHRLLYQGGRIKRLGLRGLLDRSFRSLKSFKSLRSFRCRRYLRSLGGLAPLTLIEILGEAS